MTKIIGRNVSIGFSVEKTRGTAQATVEKWMKKTNAFILEKSEVVIEDSTCGVLEDSFNRRVVKKWVEGNIDGIVQVDAIGYLFYSLFGTVTTTGSTVYTHTFSVAQNIIHPSLTLWAKNGTIEENKYAGGMVNTLNITASLDDYVRFSSAVTAKSGTSDTDAVSCDVEYDFVGKDITVKVADTEAGLSSATASKIKSLDITFDQGITPNFVLGSYSPDDINNTKFSVEGTIVKDYEDTVFKTLYQNDSAKYVQITIEGEADIGSGSHPTITILLNKAMINDWSIAGGSDEIIQETIGFKAFYNKTDTESCVLTLKNKTAEYDVPVSD